MVMTKEGKAAEQSLDKNHRLQMLDLKEWTVDGGDGGQSPESHVAALIWMERAECWPAAKLCEQKCDIAWEQMSGTAQTLARVCKEATRNDTVKEVL